MKVKNQKMLLLFLLMSSWANQVLSFEDCPQYIENSVAPLGRISSENCLTYALNVRDCSSPYMSDVMSSKDDDVAIKKLIENLNTFFYKDSEFAMVPRLHELGRESIPFPKKGYYVVAFFLAERDYHFVRQDSDGFFSHRFGKGIPCSRIDASSAKILIPHQNNFDYSNIFNEVTEAYGQKYRFVTYLYVKTGKRRILPNSDDDYYRELFFSWITASGQKLREVF